MTRLRHRQTARFWRWRSVVGPTLSIGIVVFGASCHMARSSPPKTGSLASPESRPGRCADPGTLACIPATDRLHIVIHNSRLALSPAAIFDVEQLRGILQPAAPGTAVDLGQPAAFSITVDSGRIRLSAAQLAQLMNQRVFAFHDANIRALKIATGDDLLTLSGQYRRRGWVGFSLTGPVRLAGPHTIEIVTERLRVDGRSAGALLAAAHLSLSDILQLRANGVSIAGNRLRLDVAQLLPPPRLQMTISRATVDRDGLALVLGGASRPGNTWARPAVAAPAYILLYGGRLSLGPLHLPDPRVELTAATQDAPLALDLPGYRRQLGRTTISLLSPESDAAHATFLARLPTPETAP